MPAAPKEKVASTSREKGKGKDKDHDEGGKDKEPKQRKKPGRVPTSCAECRRLKLRCDRNVPCAKCVSRGCGSICPDGTLAPGKGNRLVLANTEELHARIDAMTDRNRTLERALADLYGQSRDGQGGSVHPLLAESRLELGDLGRLSVAVGGAGLGSTSESSRSSLMVPTPSPRASTSASTHSPSSQSQPYSHSQSRSPAPERHTQASASTSQQPQRWRAVPSQAPLQRPDGDEKMEIDLDLDEGHEKDSDELETDDADDEGQLRDLNAKGTLFFSDSAFSSSKGGGGGGEGGGGSSGRTSHYYYLGRSARPEFLAQIVPPASTPPSFSSLAQIRAILPERDVALGLCDVYMAYGTSVYASVTPRAQLEQVMRGVYRAMEHSAPASGSSTLLCDTAFLLAVFALGALFSPTLTPYGDKAKTYYAASQAALDMLPRDVDAANETVLHALLHLTQFASLVSSATSSPLNVSARRSTNTNSPETYDADAGWAHAGRGVRLAQRMGLHMHISSSSSPSASPSPSTSPSSSHWPGMSEDVRKKRDSLWWALFVADTWTSFDLGRPPAVASRAYVDCEVPPNRTLPSHVDLVSADSDSIFHSWYLHFTLLLHDALDTIVVGRKRGTSTGAYASIIEHDCRIRDFYVPRAWRMTSSEPSSGTGGGGPTHEHGHDGGFAEDDDNPDAIDEDTDNPHYPSSSSGRKQDEDEMYRWLVLAAKETVLLRLHQPYLIHALTARDPTPTTADDADEEEAALRRSARYLPSVLAVYRSLQRLTNGLTRTWAAIPRFLARVGAAWSHGLSAAIAAALIASRVPDSDSALAHGALDALAALLEVFGAAAPLCPPAANMLGLVRDLHQTAAQAQSKRQHRGSSDARSLNSISPAELERLNGQTAFLLQHPNSPLPSGSHYSNIFEQPPSSSSAVYIPPQHQYPSKTYDYERHEPRLRSRATSATISEFATDTHYNQTHTLMHPHNAHYTHHPPHEGHASQAYKLPRLVMEKLHPTLVQDVRLIEQKKSLSSIGVTFHDPPSDAGAFTKKTPQQRKVSESATSISPHVVSSSAPSLPSSTYHHPQHEEPSYRNPAPSSQSQHRSYTIQPSFSEDHDQYHSHRASPNPPPRLIVDPYMPSKPHTTASTLSSMQYLDDSHSHPRGHDAYSGPHSHSYSQTQTQAHSMPDYHASSLPPPSGNIYNQRHQREPGSYHYGTGDMDEEDPSSTISSGFYTSESHVRVGGGSHSTGGHGSGGSIIGGIGGGGGSSGSSSATMTTTTTTTTATMSSISTANNAGFMPHPFVLGPLPNGFQSGFFPAGFSSGFFPSPIVLDPSWNTFVEQLGF